MDNLGTPAYNTRSKATVAVVLNKDLVPPSEAETTLGPMRHSTQIELGNESFTESDESMNMLAGTRLDSIIEGINDMVQNPSNEGWVSTPTVEELKNKYEDSFFLEMKPLLVLLRALGRFPYYFTENGIRRFRFFSLITLYTFVIFVIQFNWTLYVLYAFCLRFMASENFHDCIFWIAIGLFPVQNLSVPFTYWLEAPKLIKYINEWKIFQEDHYKEDFQLIMKKRIWRFSVICVPIAVMVVHVGGQLLGDLPIIFYVPFIFSISSRYILLFFWCSCMMEIRGIAGNLLHKLEKEAWEGTQHHRSTWLRLSELTSGLGDTVGYTFLQVLALLFGTFLLSSYGIVSSFFTRGFSNIKFIMGLSFTGILSITHQLILCDSTHRTTNVMSKDYISKILKMESACHSETIRKELFLFLKTISSSPPSVYLVRSVKITRSLGIHFLVYTVAYLVVLMQFHISANANGNSHAET